MRVAHRGPFPVPMADRLLPRIEVGPEPGNCWPWTGYVMPNGYGKLTVQRGRSNLAHRLVYETFVGPIPDGLDIDHLCRNRSCVNPDHLEPVTRAENLNRSPIVQGLRELKSSQAAQRRANRPRRHNRYKTACPQGHLYDEENTRWYRGGRRCKACDRVRANAAYRRKKKEGGGLPT